MLSATQIGNTGSVPMPADWLLRGPSWSGGDAWTLTPRPRRLRGSDQSALGAAAAEAQVDLLVTVGPLAAAMAPSFHGEHHHAADAEAAARLVPTLLRPGDAVLVKASNGVGLKLVCDTLTAVTPA